MLQKMLYLYYDQLLAKRTLWMTRPPSCLQCSQDCVNPSGQLLCGKLYSEFKRLEAGTINELNVGVTDEYQRKIANHGLQMSIILKIQ